MKTEKMSFKNIKDLLTRDEIKAIVAGSGSGSGSGCVIRCNQDTQDTKPVTDCSRSTAESACNGNVSNAVCIC
jgi:hypothetical protein